MLLVEQNATVALAVAHSGYIMENGKIVIDGPAERLAQDADVREFYLGMGGGGEAKSFRDLKHYKRRSEEHTSELQSPCNLVCRLLLEKKKQSTKGVM